MKNLLIATLLVVIEIYTSTMASAADIYIEKSSLYLQGEIRQGDAERLASLAKDSKIIVNIKVNSPGGDLAESLLIANLIKDLHISVRVVNGGYCVSSCFFLLLEGYERYFQAYSDSGILPSQFERENFMGFVGIHRPYFKSSSGSVESSKMQNEMMLKVRGYLASKTVPQYLIDEMMARPSNDIYWLKVHDEDLIGDINPGDEEALINKCGYKRIHVQSKERWSGEKTSKLIDCMNDYWEEQYYPLQLKFIAKLRTGWRPWKR